VALYDLALVSLLVVVLVLFLRRSRGLDFLRTDPVRALGLTGTQLASIAVLATVVLWLALGSRRALPHRACGIATHA
jgi:hypothetical protein